MSVKDYTQPVYEKLNRLNDQVSLMKAFLDLVPETEDASESNPVDIARIHAAIISDSLDDVWEKFSGMSCGLQMHYDTKETDGE